LPTFAAISLLASALAIAANPLCRQPKSG
jgi:hypothetical protein